MTASLWLAATTGAVSLGTTTWTFESFAHKRSLLQKRFDNLIK